MLGLSKLSSLSRNVWVLGTASLLNDVSSEMIHSLLPVFLATVLGASVTTIGAIEGFAESTASVLKVFSGALSDYLGRRKWIVVGGYGLSTVMKPLFALAQSSFAVAVARTSDRIGKGVRAAPRDALLADSVDAAQRGAAFGFRQSMDTVGACLGPTAAMAIMFMSHADYRLVFWLALIPAVIAVLTLAFGIVEPKPDAERPKAKNPLRREALRQLGFSYWLLVVVALVFNLGNSSDAFLLLRAKDVGVPAALVPLGLLVMNIVYAASAYPLGAISDRMEKSQLLVMGFILYAAVYGGFALAFAPWHIWVLFAIYGLHLGMTQGILLAMVADRVDKEQRGTAFGFINLATGITLLPASLAAGVLWDKVSPAAPFVMGAACAVVASAILLIGLRRQTPKQNR